MKKYAANARVAMHYHIPIDQKLWHKHQSICNESHYDINAIMLCCFFVDTEKNGLPKSGFLCFDARWKKPLLKIVWRVQVENIID